jgi:hypothetical protein
MSFAAHFLTFLVISASLAMLLAAHIRIGKWTEYYDDRLERIRQRIRDLESRL